MLAALGPHVLWVLFLAWVLHRVGWEAIRNVIRNVNAIEVAGVRVEVESGVESAAIARGVDVPAEERRLVAERLQSAQRRLGATRVLWIDDSPTGNEAEIGVLKSLGVTIDLARSDSEAQDRLDGAVYDIVLSDIRRGGSGDAGIRFLPEATEAMLGPPVIFYVGESKGTPDGAFGIATRPDELMHLIVDALQRRGH